MTWLSCEDERMQLTHRLSAEAIIIGDKSTRTNRSGSGQSLLRGYENIRHVFKKSKRHSLFINSPMGEARTWSWSSKTELLGVKAIIAHILIRPAMLWLNALHLPVLKTEMSLLTINQQHLVPCTHWNAVTQCLFDMLSEWGGDICPQDKLGLKNWSYDFLASSEPGSLHFKPQRKYNLIINN